MQQPQRSHGIAAEAGKIVFRQIERQRDAAHHPFTQREHHVHISLHHRPEVRPLRRPLIGAVIEQPGDDTRIVRRVFRTDIIALLQIGRRARLERLALQRLVAAIGVRARFVDQRFLLGRQSEERGGFGEDALDQRLLDAMIFDVEKTLVEAGAM